MFLSLALKTIPTGTAAYAVWMGASLVGALITDVALFKEPWSPFRVACTFIVAGTCGLRLAGRGDGGSPQATRAASRRIQS